MQRDIANKLVDAALKNTQTMWESWKTLSAAVAAGVAVTCGLFALIVWVLVHVQ
jgi:hypothetical protein